MVKRLLIKRPIERSKDYRTFLFRVSIVSLVLVSLAGATFLFFSLYFFLRGASFLRVKEVRIEGNNRISTEKILAITELDDENLLSLDIKALSRRLAQHPWIEKSMIKRVFPNGIQIIIHERKPIAVIYLDRFYYVDAQGAIFDQAKGRDKAAYPILTGISREDLEKGDKKARILLRRAFDFIEIIQKDTIFPYRSISQIHLDRAVGLLVYTLDQGTEIRMGFDGFEKKLRRISKVWSIIRPMEADYVDAIIPGKIIVKRKRAEK
jgi:cell division septal protein FtsQ